MNDFDKFQRILRGEKLAGCELPAIESPDKPAHVIEYIKPKSKRGGARKGAGRKTLSPDCATVHIDFSLPVNLLNKAKLIGGGNISAGIRLALDSYSGG